MSDARVDAYNKVHQNAQRRRIAEVGKRVSGVKDARAVQPHPLRIGHLFLQADEFEAWVEQPLEQPKIYASALVRYWVPAPNDANSRFGFAAEPMLPRGYLLFIGRNVARAGYA